MSKMISVASGFQYSVNIGFDLNHDDKLKNFIPTKSSIQLLQDILESTKDSSTERARVLVGAYGKGKSHIVLTILSILMRKDWQLFTKLKEKIQPDSDIHRLITNYYESNKKLLPVIINSNGTSIQQDFLLALQKTLSENQLLDIMPDTNYQAAINSIIKWKNEFPDTCKKFRNEIGLPIETFISKLQNYDIEAYSDFEKLYPKLTSGSTFNPFLGFDVTELYESVVKSIEKKGYSGIFVVYDEFSKFLEANIKNTSVSDTKLLQDFAEKCNRSGNKQLHIMLISHKEISNYIDKLPKQKVDGWRGVSERFKHIHLNNNFTQTYEIISSVIIKDKDKWNNFQDNYSDSFNQLLNRYVSHAIFSDMKKDECEVTIRGCYPLHPVSTFILPRLSEQVAQNERTLFTFLSAKGVSTLSSFLEGYSDSSFQVITPDLIFDYFESLFRKESYSSELHKNYSLAKTILNKLEKDSLQSKIIKTLSLIYILEQFDKIKPTIEELYGIYSIDYTHDEILRSIDFLINKEYVVYLKVSNEYLRLKQSSGIDIKQKIADTIERSSANFSVKDTLNASCLDNYMYPSRYNDEREMIRYFMFKFIDAKEVTRDVDWNLKIESIDADGVIYGIIPDNEESIANIKNIIEETSKNSDRCIFILPKKYSEIHESVIKYNAVINLKKEAEGDDILFDEYEVIYEDLRDVILEFISSYTHPEYFKSTYIYNGQEQQISRKAALSSLMSEICEKIYSKTPLINNEAINKKELTGTASTSRNKILAGLLRNTLEANLGLSGTGQEVSIMRSTLIRKNILITDQSGLTKINLITGDSDMDNMLGTIVDFIRKAKNESGNNFDNLYRALISPEGKIGIRKSLILIYLASVLHEYRHQVVIVGNNGQLPLNVDTLLQIESSPASFKLKYLEWDMEKELFISKLEDTYKDFIIDSERNLNSYDFVVSAMKRWCMSLPKYSREIRQEGIVKGYRSTLRLLTQNIGNHELLFERLPKEFDFGTFNSALADKIKEVRAYYDGLLSELTLKLINIVKDIFSSGIGKSIHVRSSVSSIIKDWCDGLNPLVFEQMFENGTNRCLDLFKNISNDEALFISRLAKLVTDLRIEDWDTRTIDLFIEKLKEYKSTAENFSVDTTSSSEEGTNTYVLTYIDKSGNSVTKRFDSVEQSNRGKLLMNSLLSDIESMGCSISEQEKRQILMEVLKKLC